MGSPTVSMMVTIPFGAEVCEVETLAEGRKESPLTLVVELFESEVVLEMVELLESEVEVVEAGVNCRPSIPVEALPTEDFLLCVLVLLLLMLALILSLVEEVGASVWARVTTLMPTVAPVEEGMKSEVAFGFFII